MAREVRKSGEGCGDSSRAMGLCVFILFNLYIDTQGEAPLLGKIKFFNVISPPRHRFEDECTINIF